MFTVLEMPNATGGDDATGPDRDWLLKLATALQTTLDVESLIQLFDEHVATIVPHDSLEFTDGADLQVQVGKGGEHHCTYDLVLEDKRFGTLSFGRTTPFSRRETVVLEDVLANLVHPLRNALMYREAVQAAARDPLTGVNNRSSLKSVLEREVELSRRHGTALSVIMLDVDRFKHINDRYGHLTGDLALTALAQCLCDCIRDSDMAFRYGGEEFCVVLSNTSLAGAANLAERIRGAVERLTIPASTGPLHTTVSLGVAALAPGEGYERLLNKADAALYLSKSRGRNRVSTEDDLAS